MSHEEIASPLDGLASDATRARVLAELIARGAAARPLIRCGLGDGRWAVRRACLAWTWRAGDASDVEAALPLLRDPRAAVRQAAVVAVGTAHTRVSGAPAAVPHLLERALGDPSLRVRRQAVVLLAWEHAHPHLEGFFRDLLASETDPRLHRFAGIGLVRCGVGAIAC